MPDLNELFVFACVGGIVGAPFFFRFWLVNKGKEALDSIDVMTSRLSLFIFAALFAGAFVFSSHSPKTAEVLLGASILSFSILYQVRYHFLQSNQYLPPRKNTYAILLKEICLFALVGSLIYAASRYPALILLFFFVPGNRDLLIRLRYPTSKMVPSDLKLEFAAIFEKAGSPIKEIYLVDAPGRFQSNAMVTGRSLFFALDVFNKLNETELKAVVAHEASHLALGHPWKRTLASVGSMMAAFFWFMFPVTVSFPSGPQAFFYTVPFIFLVQNFLFNKVSRKQEMEADLGALELGARAQDLISALHKLSPTEALKKSWSTRQIFGNAYPSLEERTLVILNQRLPENAYFQNKKYAYAYTLLIFIYSFSNAQRIHNSLNRQPANQNQSANIAHLGPDTIDRNDH